MPGAEIRGFSGMSNVDGLLPKSPGANIKEFLVTILSEANFRVVKNSFQRAKGGLGNKPLRPDTFSYLYDRTNHVNVHRFCVTTYFSFSQFARGYLHHLLEDAFPCTG